MIDVTPDVSGFNPPLFSEKELIELEDYVNRKMEPEPENTHVKINIRASAIRSSINLPLNEIEDDDPEVISNLISTYDKKEVSTKSIFSMTPGSTLDYESVFNRYEIPFFSSKTNFKNNADETRNESPENNDSVSKNDELNDEKAKLKDKIGVIIFIFAVNLKKKKDIRRKTYDMMKSKVLEQILKDDRSKKEYNFIFHDQKFLVK